MACMSIELRRGSLRFRASAPFKMDTATRIWIHQRRVRHQAKFSFASMLAKPILQPRSRRGFNETVLVVMVALLYNIHKNVLEVLGFASKLADGDTAAGQ